MITPDPTEFAGKRVLVSGDTKGLGRATVDRFLAGGTRVITAARGTPEPIDGVEFVQADLTTAHGGEPETRTVMTQPAPREALRVRVRGLVDGLHRGGPFRLGLSPTVGALRKNMSAEKRLSGHQDLEPTLRPAMVRAGAVRSSADRR
jgi:NAD(P)-dependent dehydrogenase (short-subunit alcohol dehydrogenase family)